MKESTCKRTILIVAVVIVLSSAGCREIAFEKFNKYPGALCLESEEFEQENLRRIFQEHLAEYPEGEIFYKVHTRCDPDNNVPYGPPDAPGAYLFRIRGNSFYVVDDQTGSPVWHILEGENVLIEGAKKSLDPPLPDLKVEFAYQQITISGPEISQRELVFVVQNLSDLEPSDLKSLVDYYVTLLPFPDHMTLDLANSYPTACWRAGISYEWLGTRVGLCDAEWLEAERPADYYRVTVRTELLPGLRIYRNGRMVHEEAYERPPG